jgi:hypothetical protein
MHEVVRTYSGKGASELMGVLEKNKAELDRLIRAVDGFVSFPLVRTASGGFSVPVFRDKAGTDESVRLARNGSQRTLATLKRLRPISQRGIGPSPTRFCSTRAIAVVK